ncbi:hypothetical protein RRG08_012887 [Elysia crispata]|uniref:Uncharacterized protein n=1 Tax=Elysia crispata TaxID=231223 RepID=A0AAE1ATS2_9GAST|nr:hypothetical protein RRG08_012887 [Elysia crispata]
MGKFHLQNGTTCADSCHKYFNLSYKRSEAPNIELQRTSDTRVNDSLREAPTETQFALFTDHNAQDLKDIGALSILYRTDYGAIQSGWQISRSESIRPKLSYSRDRDTIKPIIKYFVTRRGVNNAGKTFTRLKASCDHVTSSGTWGAKMRDFEG